MSQTPNRAQPTPRIVDSPGAVCVQGGHGANISIIRGNGNTTVQSSGTITLGSLPPEHKSGQFSTPAPIGSWMFQLPQMLMRSQPFNPQPGVRTNPPRVIPNSGQPSPLSLNHPRPNSQVTVTTDANGNISVMSNGDLETSW